jgi:hypothetical protein
MSLERKSDKEAKKKERRSKKIGLTEKVSCSKI